MQNYFADDAATNIAGLFSDADTARRAVETALPLIEDAILYEHSVGDRSRWDADYGEFARSKARLHWRTGMNTHLLQPAETVTPEIMVLPMRETSWP